MFGKQSPIAATGRLSPLGIERHLAENMSESTPAYSARLAELETRVRTKEEEILHLSQKINDVQSQIARLRAEVNTNKTKWEAAQSLLLQQRQLLSKRSRAFLQILQSGQEQQNAQIERLSRDQFAQIEAEGERIFHQICNRFEQSTSGDQIMADTPLFKKARLGTLPRKRQLQFESAEPDTPLQMDLTRARVG